MFNEWFCPSRRRVLVCVSALNMHECYSTFESLCLVAFCWLAVSVVLFFFFFCKFSSVYLILFTFHDHPSDDWLRERRQTAIRLWIHTTKNTNIFERILTADRFSVHCPSPPVNSKRAINYSRLTRSTMTDARARELQRRPGQTDQMWKRKDAYGTHVTRVRTH